MSVTFSPELIETPTYHFQCSDEHCNEKFSEESYMLLADIYNVHSYTCNNTGDIEEEYSDARLGININMSNINASAVLPLMGIDVTEDLCGTMDADDLLGRVLVALAMNQDDGYTPTVIEGNITLVGRRPGYFNGALHALRTVAQAAKELGVQVVWG